jgi:hypothetical protein
MCFTRCLNGHVHETMCFTRCLHDHPNRSYTPGCTHPCVHTPPVYIDPGVCTGPPVCTHPCVHPLVYTPGCTVFYSIFYHTPGGVHRGVYTRGCTERGVCTQGGVHSPLGNRR